MAVTRNGTVETRTTGIESCLGAGGRAVPDFPVPGDGGGEPGRRNAVSRPMAGPAFASRVTAAIRPTTPRTTIIQLYLLLAPPPPTSPSPSPTPPLPPQTPPLRRPHPPATATLRQQPTRQRQKNSTAPQMKRIIWTDRRSDGRSRLVASWENPSTLYHWIATGTLSAFNRRLARELIVPDDRCRPATFHPQ